LLDVCFCSYGKKYLQNIKFQLKSELR